MPAVSTYEDRRSYTVKYSTCDIYVGLRIYGLRSKAPKPYAKK